MLVKPTQREAAQGIIQLLFCISRGSDNGPCLKRTRRIDGRAHHRPLYHCKQAAHKKTSVPELAVSRVYDGGAQRESSDLPLNTRIIRSIYLRLNL